MAAALALATVLIWCALRIQSTRLFLSLTTVGWLITRGGIVLLFPKYILLGDERYFHKFVSALAAAISEGKISALSNIYDFPVWLARSFPFYLPLAAVFGANDIWAARLLNVLLGAGQLLCLFFIARQLIGGRAARLCCLLLLLFPYHCINVLSYDPQIAGTFFLLIAVWMFLCLNKRSTYPAPSLIGIGGCLALSLLLAGIQRGGIDFLMVGVIAIVLSAQWLKRAPRMNSRHAVVCVSAVCLIWLPLRIAFDSWIASQDTSRLRTHTLGFMTRGWNLDSAGEYLPLYEQLDIASAKAEKQRTLEAVLVTEFARQPIRSLLFLVPVKTAKFFAIGYASTAEQGLIAAGYARATLLYQWLRSLYAPLTLALCLSGLIACWQSQRLQLRLMVPVLLMVISCLAIVLIWETSPRYSHVIHFALLLLATVGIARFSRSSDIIRFRPPFVLEFASSGAAVAVCWLTLSVCIVGVARSATNYQFLDPRAISAHVGKRPVEVEPLNSFSTSWEGAIRLPPGTTLPATVNISFPTPRTAGWNHLSVSVWLPDLPMKNETTYRVSCQTIIVPAASSGRISRVEIPRNADNASMLTLSIASPAGHSQTASALRLGIGYALAN